MSCSIQNDIVVVFTAGTTESYMSTVFLILNENRPSTSPSLEKTLVRRQAPALFKKLSPCLVGMAAGATAHYWAREIAALG